MVETRMASRADGPAPKGTLSPREPFAGPFAWHGGDLARTEDWVRRLTPAENAEIAAALRTVAARGMALLDITREDFPLPTLAPALAGIMGEVEAGRGFVLLRGL